jgi:hypothetical protein
MTFIAIAAYKIDLISLVFIEIIIEDLNLKWQDTVLNEFLYTVVINCNALTLSITPSTSSMKLRVLRQYETDSPPFFFDIRNLYLNFQEFFF